MIIAIYKEKGPTSRDVLNKIKRITGNRKVGHAGTLDPLAEGVLVVGIGRESTKKLWDSCFDEKEYLATIRLGMTSTTDDKEGEKKRIEECKVPDYLEAEKAVFLFLGEIEQTPPRFSAVKIKGKEAYKYARKNLPIKMQRRKALIKEIEIISYRYPLLKVRVVTGKGVYIRSLARDIGKALKTGGYLCVLIRTRVGSFKEEDCVDNDFLRSRFR